MIRLFTTSRLSHWLLLVAGVCVLVWPFVAAAQFNPEINYQGKLADNTGSTVADGDYDMVFRLYTAASGGSPIWTETRTGADQVTVTSGLFSVMLGDVSSLSGVDFDQTLYLSVEVDSDGEMTPRKVLGAVPAAFQAQEADNAATVGGVASTSLLRSDQADTLEATESSTLLTVTQNGTGNLLDLYDGASNVFTVLDGGNVGIGTTTPQSLLDVWGDFRVGTSGTPTMLVDTATNQLVLGTTTPHGDSGIYLEDRGISFRNSARLDRTNSLSVNGLGYLVFDGPAAHIFSIGSNEALRVTNTGVTINISNDSSYNFAVQGATDSRLLYTDAANDTVGISTSTATQTFTVDGDAYLTGSFYDSTNSAGTNGMVLQTTGSGTEWVATSTLGISGGASDFVGLSDTQSSLTANRIPFTNAVGDALVDSTNFVFDGTNLGLGLGSDEPEALFHTGNLLTAGSDLASVSDLTWLLDCALSAGSCGSTNRAAGFGVRTNSIDSNARDILLGAEDVAIFRGNQATPYIYMDGSSGSLGVGTTTPSKALSVVGDAIITGSLSAKLQLDGGYLSGDGDIEGVYVGDNGFVGISSATSSKFTLGGAQPEAMLHVSGISLATSSSMVGSVSEYALLLYCGLQQDACTDMGRTVGMAVRENADDENRRDLFVAGEDIIFARASAASGYAAFDASQGYFGIGTTTPSSRLTVAGDAYITGALRDSSNSAGTNGYVLQTTGSGTEWVATSTLGLGGGGASTFTGLTDTQGSLTANRLIFTNSGGTALTDSSGLTFDGTNLDLAGTNTGLAFQGTRFFYASTTLDNIAIGEGAGENMVDNGNGGDNFNVFLGYQAGQNASSTGFFVENSNNNFIGYRAGQYNAGNFNNIFGVSAGQNNTGSTNNLFGALAGANNIGESNNIFGEFAGYNNASSDNNLIGESAGYNNAGESNNILGFSAGYNNIGYSNNLIGRSAGYDNTGFENNIFGASAGYNNTGSYSEFIGYEAARLMSASNTIAIGRESLRGGSGTGGNAATTTNNTALGAFAGYSAQTGADNNLLLGYRAGYSLTTGANNIAIGYDIDLPSNTASNQLNIGNLIFGTDIDGTGTTLSSGNIGIGTSTPSSLLTLERTGLDGDNITGGITQNYEFVNSGTSELVYGNEMNIVNNPSSANAMAGSIIKVEDSTSLANTVRGLEVQADGGTNTQGENTALSGFARTFGVRGVTRGDAGGTFEPAGVYGATQGTTQGNALRGFSDTITSADLMSLLQESSSFSGTGLLMNFGSGGGSYSGNFLDLQVNGATQFSVSATGTVSIAGALLDSSGSAGTSGQILESTATGTQWVTGGGGGGSTTFLGLTDTPGSFTAGRIPFTNGAADALTDSANLTFAGNLLSVNGTISVNDGTAGNEIYGLGASSAGAASSTIIGNGAQVTAGSSYDSYVVIGEGASAGGFGNNTVIGAGASGGLAGSTVVGQGSSADSGGTVFGQDSSVDGSRSVIVGYGNQAAQDAIAIGQGLSPIAGEIHIGNSATAGFAPDLVLMGSTGQFTERSPFRINTDWLDSTDGSRRSQAELIVENSSGSQTFLQADATASGVDSFFLGGDVAIGTTSKETLLTVDGITTTNQLNIGGHGMIFDDANKVLLIGRDLDFDDTIDGSIAGGGDNLAIGSVALDSVTTGSGNIAIGEGGGNGPGRNITSGNNNIVIGASFSGTNISTGNNNSIYGSRSAYALTTGSANSLYGYEAGYEFRSGDNNTFIGEDSGFNLATSTDSTLIGQNAGEGTSDFSASRLTVLGSEAGASLSTGADNNILLGYQAGDNITTGASNLIIGYSVDAPSATTDNQLVIGNLIYGTSIDGTGTTMSSGSIGIGNSSPSVLLHVGDSSVSDGTNLLRLEDTNSTCDFNADTGTPSCGSDRTLKTDISTIEGELDKVLALEPSYWRWKTEDNDDPLKSGFIAQDVEEVLPELVTENVWVDGSTKKFLNIGGMMPYVVGAIKEMWETITLHDERIADLENENEDLQDRLEALEAAVQSGGTANVSGSTGGSAADEDSTDTSSAGADTSSSTDTETDTEPAEEPIEDDSTATTSDETETATSSEETNSATTSDDAVVDDSAATATDEAGSEDEVFAEEEAAEDTATNEDDAGDSAPEQEAPVEDNEDTEGDESAAESTTTTESESEDSAPAVAVDEPTVDESSN